ncbi:MAG: tetratricopeptide repeat protein [Candidatus Micrarchaeota archaeon]
MTMDAAKGLLSSGKYREAAELLDNLLSAKPENDELWYLRGIASLKAGNNKGAQQSFIRATFIKKRGEYFRMMGIAHMEVFELEEAIDAFQAALEMSPKDVQSAFFLSVCYMFFDSPKSVKYIKLANSIDKTKTRQLLNNFYSVFFGGNKKLDEKAKNKIRAALKKI